MSFYHPYSIFPLGDEALIVDFGNLMDPAVHQSVLGLFDLVRKAAHPCITGLVPAYSSLTVCFDAFACHQQAPETSAFGQMSGWIEGLAGAAVPEAAPGRHFDIPVCYAPRFGPDQEEIAQHHRITAQRLIELHTGTLYRVYMIGFLPGFAYMGEVPGQIAMPRRTSPRAQVTAGSVGIAGRQTGIYPLDAPGGWQIIGRTPVLMFRPYEQQPALLAAGDEVKFYSITENEFTDYQARNA